MIIENFKIMFYQSGVLPNIQQSILPRFGEERPEKEYMNRLALVRKYQANTDLLISATLISEPLQVFIEQMLVDKLSRAFQLTAKRGESMLTKDDIELFKRIDTNITIQYGMENIEVELSEDDIDKLGHRAGIPIISNKAYEVINMYVSEMVSLIIHYTYALVKEGVEESMSLSLAINMAYGINFIIP